MFEIHKKDKKCLVEIFILACLMPLVVLVEYALFPFLWLIIRSDYYVVSVGVILLLLLAIVLWKTVCFLKISNTNFTIVIGTVISIFSTLFLILYVYWQFSSGIFSNLF